MKKFVLSAAVLAIATTGMTAAVNISVPGTAAACVGTPATSSKLAASLPQVNYGDTGRHVLALQLALRKEGYDYLQGTGNYVTLTRAAVQDFQRRHGIKASGIVGSKTWQALVGRKSVAQTGAWGIKPPTFGINPGERNSEKMGWLVNALERIHPYGTQVTSDYSVYGSDTKKLVQDFQRRAGIKASGIVGPKTWAAMYEVVAVSGNWGC